MPYFQPPWPTQGRWPRGQAQIPAAPPAGPIDLLVDDAFQAQSTDAIDLTQVHVLTVADATQAQSTDAIALTQVHVLTVNDATQAQSTDPVVLTQLHVLAINDATQAQTVDAITLTVDGVDTAPVQRRAAVLL